MLKRTFAAAVMLACVPLAHADDFCDAIAEMAGNAMDARQKEVPLKDFINAARKTSGEKGKPYEPMIFEAYKRPLVQGKEAKASAVKEYSNLAYIGCMKTAK